MTCLLTDMKKIVPILGILVLGYLPLAAKPNIVLIIADDATYRDLEVYGGQAKTPHLNALVRESM